MPLLRVGLVVLLLLALALAAGFVVLDRYLQSPAFKQAALRSAHDALGADVQIGQIRVSLLSGATLEHVVVANPAGFPGDFLRADALVLRYRLWPLLRKRLEIQQVSLTAPVLALSRGDHGAWNYERLGARSTPPMEPSAPRAAAPAPAEPSGTPRAVSGLDVVLPKLTVDGGTVVVTGERERRLVRLERLNLTTSVSWAGGSLRGSGTTTVDTVSVADLLAIRRLAASLSVTASQVTLAPLRGTVAGGELTGDLAVSLADGLKYAANLEVRNADVQKLTREAGAHRDVISGRLHARARLQGTGGLPALTGSGRVEVLAGRLLDVPVLSSLELLLQIPGLRELRFDECWVDFTLADQVLQTPALRIASRDIQITGAGAVSLTAGTLAHQMTLALPKSVVGRAPREVRAAFTERADGWMTVDFRVWGAYDAPRTDLQDRLLKGVTEGLLKRGLRKLFK